MKNMFTTRHILKEKDGTLQEQATSNTNGSTIHQLHV